MVVGGWDVVSRKDAKGTAKAAKKSVLRLETLRAEQGFLFENGRTVTARLPSDRREAVRGNPKQMGGGKASFSETLAGTRFLLLPSERSQGVAGKP
jgi:hypothetical protein